MAKRFLTIVVLLAVIFGGIFGYKAYDNKQAEEARTSAPPPTVYVSSTTVKTQDWQPRLSSIGSVTAVNGVEVTTQIAGQVKKIYFKSGDHVQKGQLLAYLDDATNVQTLNNYLALLHLSELDLKRKRAVYASGGISKSTLDAAASTYEQDLANVKYTQAQISYKHIRAPFSGVVGIRQINLGQYLSPADSIVNLQSMSPLYVDFQVPERYLPDLNTGVKVFASVDDHPGKTFNGTISAVDSAVSTDNRNVTVRASFANKEGLLYPGQFASIALNLSLQKDALTVPLTAVTYSIYGDTVFVLTKKTSASSSDDDDSDSAKAATYKVSQKVVKITDQRGNTAVLTNLKKGQLVVTSGQTKLQAGMTVELNNVATLPSMAHQELSAE